MARELGGTVEANDVSEYGKADVELDGESRCSTTCRPSRSSG